MLIDPTRFTSFERTDAELEVALLFSILTAGKRALTTAPRLDSFLRVGVLYDPADGERPFERIAHYGPGYLTMLLKMHGLGCYIKKGRAIHELVHKGLNLRSCSLEELEALYQVGPKTARFFLLHTRPEQQLAVLDTHILRHLGHAGYRVPMYTPTSPRRYRELEAICLRLAKAAGKTPAEWDLAIWNQEREWRQKNSAKSGRKPLA